MRRLIRPRYLVPLGALAAVALGVTAAVVVPGSGGPATVPPADGAHIAYVSCHEASIDDPRARRSIASHWERSVCTLGTIRPDGSDPEMLVDDVAEVSEPQWSPDGRYLAFTSARNHMPYGIYRVGWDGEGLERLTADDATANDPRWSPDGRELAYTTSVHGVFDVYVSAADGSDVRNVTEDDEYDTLPLWSPDGATLMFRRGRDFAVGTSKAEIWAVAAAGGEAERLAANPAFSASWSPDGRHIAYTSFATGESTVVVARADGSEAVDIGQGASPAWSPDGDRLAFFAPDGHETDVFVAAPDGSGRANLTHSPGDEQSVSWAPDGEHLLFASNEAGSFDIWSVAVDGSDLVRLTTDDEGNEVLPVWSPQAATG